MYPHMICLVVENYLLDNFEARIDLLSDNRAAKHIFGSLIFKISADFEVKHQYQLLMGLQKLTAAEIINIVT